MKKVALLLALIVAPSVHALEVVETKTRQPLPDLLCVVRETDEGRKYQAVVASDSILKDGPSGMPLLYSNLMDSCLKIDSLKFLADMRFGFVSVETKVLQISESSHQDGSQCKTIWLEASVHLSPLGDLDDESDSVRGISLKGRGSKVICE